MADRQQQGDLFADYFTLLQSLQRTAHYQQWLAIDNRSGQKVCITIFPSGATQLDRLTSISHHLKRLIHPNIAQHLEIGHVDQDLYSVDQYEKVTGSLNTDSGLDHNSLLFKQLLDTLDYSHDLGFFHGNLTRERIQIKENGQLYLTQFGWPPGMFDQADLSQKESTGANTDIHRLGQLIYTAATGQSWIPGAIFVSDSPVEPDVKLALEAMLQESDASLKLNLAEIKTLIFESDTGIGAATNLISAQRFAPASASTTINHQSAQTPQIPGRDNSSLSPWLIALTVLLITAGLFIFLILPELVSPSTTETLVKNPPAPTESSNSAKDLEEVEPTLAPIEAAQLAIFQKDSAVTAESFLRILLDLEDRGVAQWDTESLERINKSAAEADELFKQDQFQQALLAYKELLASVTELQNKLPIILEQQIKRAETALNDGDASQAQTAWKLVSQIQPEEASHLIQLARAEQLPQVLTLIESGLKAEQQGDLTQAVADLERAYNLDHEWPAARQQLERLQKELANRNFNIAMSNGFDALAAKQYSGADKAFSQAAAIKPASTAPTDGLQQVLIARKQALITSKQTSAQTAIKDENWLEAATIFESILNMDDTLLFASEGLKLAQSRIEIQKRLTDLLANPTSLQQDPILSDAKLLAIELSRLTPPRDRIQEPLSQLTRLISVARIPIPVTIESNNRTTVSILRMGEQGQLGLINEQTLLLIPGRYVIIGKRRGYRDIRKEITLTYGSPKSVIDVSCEEAI
jgi:serine/threonine protein kinase